MKYALVIRTKYLGPTTHRGARITATGDDPYGLGRKTVTANYDHALNTVDNHAAAARAWFDKHADGAPITHYADSAPHSDGFLFIAGNC